MGIIQPINSPYSSPLWLVPKHVTGNEPKKYRAVIDYRSLHAIAVEDSYPLQDMGGILDQVSGAHIIWHINLVYAYHQLPLTEERKKYTTFSCPFGLFAYCSSHMGFCNSPSAFSRLIYRVIGGLKDTFAYLDDVVVHSHTFEEHYQKMRTLFQSLKEAKLLMDPKKCKLFCREAVFLIQLIMGK